jgi:hypothetical protein
MLTQNFTDQLAKAKKIKSGFAANQPFRNSHWLA